MFIALTRDQATKNGISRFLKQFPTEVAQTLDQITAADYDLTYLKEKPITRITVLGHAHTNKYGGMDSAMFAEHLIQILKKNEAVSPGFMAGLEAIDLLGCELGFINTQQASYAFEVAMHLRNNGYHIPLHSFTIPDYTQNQFQETLLTNKIDFWGFYGFKTAEDAKQYLEHIKLLDNISRKIENNQAEIYTLDESIGYLNAENINLQAEIETSYINIKKRKDAATTPKQQAKFVKLEIGWQQIVNEKRLLIQNNKAKIAALSQTTDQLNNECQAFADEYNELKQKLTNFCIEIARTDHPREYFAQHPDCNFTHLVQAYSQTNRTKRVDAIVDNKVNTAPITRAIKTSLKREKITTDQDPLSDIPSKPNLTNRP